jgi:5'-3' exonuclease
LSLQILAGCDYLDSIPGIGIKTAHKLLRKHKTVEKVIYDCVRRAGNLTDIPLLFSLFSMSGSKATCLFQTITFSNSNSPSSYSCIKGFTIREASRW